jgi:hypothetical protein
MANAQIKDVPHPFLLWTAEEAAAIRKRLATDPAAKAQYERMEAVERGKGGHPSLFNLFKYGVLGDEGAGQAEKQRLLGFVGRLPPAAKPGNPATGNAPWRDDRTLDALRYDILYDLLTPEERQAVEKTIRAYVEWFQENPGCRGSRGDRPRTGWLPNMQWPTFAGIHVLAVASKDEKLIKQVFETPRGWKWFFDVYIADGRFYMEEFAKYPSNIGAMLLWCEGLERLGLSQYGYGYTGKGGANMKNYLQMLIWAGYPRIERPGGTPDYPCVTMGDASPSYILQGYNADGTGGTPWYHNPMMWGSVPKMMQPLWWEAGHRRFPDAGFDYFLAQLRRPNEDLYYPSLYFGLKPIDPKKAMPPPAPSYVAPERGFAMLRMEEGPAYWESPRPAVALQFGSYYVHYVHDCFSILQYVAHNRHIYNRMGSTRGGYAGGDPWRDHVRGQASGVVVDGLQAQPIDTGEEGIRNQRLRHRFDPQAKFVAIRAAPVDVEERTPEGEPRRVRKAIYPDVDLERALVLTDQYLLDVFWLHSDRPRVYDWHVLAPASLQTGKPLADKDWAPLEQSPWQQRATKPHLTDVRVREVGSAPWAAVLCQDHLPRGIGVKVWMLGGEDTLLVAGKPPVGNEVGIKLLATRHAPRTVFTALHEPFANNSPRIRRFERVEQAADALAVRITGEDWEDRVLLHLGPSCQEPLTLAGDGEQFTFSGYVHLRIDKAEAKGWGDLRAMKLRVSGKPQLVLNGQAVAATVSAGLLSYVPPAEAAR